MWGRCSLSSTSLGGKRNKCKQQGRYAIVTALCHAKRAHYNNTAALQTALAAAFWKGFLLLDQLEDDPFGALDQFNQNITVILLSH